MTNEVRIWDKDHIRSIYLIPNGTDCTLLADAPDSELEVKLNLRSIRLMRLELQRIEKRIQDASGKA